MNALNWLRKAAAQTLDLAAEGYGALASWCVRTSEQLDPYTESDYRHARKVIADASKAIAEDEKPPWKGAPFAYKHSDGTTEWITPGQFPRAELRDADHTDFATGGLVHPDGTRMDYDGWHYTRPDGSGINIGRSAYGLFQSLSATQKEHRYNEADGICSCGWPTGKHPSEADDE